MPKEAAHVGCMVAFRSDKVNKHRDLQRNRGSFLFMDERQKDSE